MNHRLLVLSIFVLNLVAWLPVIELNSFFAAHGITLHLDVLLILFSTLYLPTIPSLSVAVGFGFFLGATRPMPIGATLLSFLALWLATIWMGRRIRRDRALHLAGTAAGLQAGLILVYGFLLRPLPPVSGWLYSQRILVDLLLSAGVAALLATPWVRVQFALMAGSGWRPSNESAHS